jgi:hypothetical protein
VALNAGGAGARKNEMTTTFDFDEWLNAADPCDAANVAGLVQAVEGECEFSGFKAERAKNGKLIVSADGLDLKLILSTKKAEEGFVSCIHARYVEPGMSAEIQAVIEHLNDRD